MLTDYYDHSSFNSAYAGLNSNKFLSLFHLNVRSIRNKQDTLDNFFANISLKFDLLLFSETWLSELDTPPKFYNYSYCGLTRAASRGGGVAMYIKNNLTYDLLHEFSFISENVECLSISLKSLTVVLIYRPPSGNKSQFLIFLDKILDFLTHSGSMFVIMGDMNINMLGTDGNASELDNIVASYGCSNLIKTATRIAEGSATLLDLCITNAHAPNISNGLFSADISDHLPIFCLVPMCKSVSSKGHCTAFYRDINPQSLDVFRLLVIATHWDFIQEIKDPQQSYKIFLEKLKHCYEQAFLLKPVTNNGRKE